MRNVGIPGREPADGGPIKPITPMGEEPQKSVVQQAGNRHRHALTLGRGQPEPDVFVTKRRGEKSGFKLVVCDEATEDLVCRRGEDRGCE